MYIYKWSWTVTSVPGQLFLWSVVGCQIHPLRVLYQLESKIAICSLKEEIESAGIPSNKWKVVEQETYFTPHLKLSF